jgi:trans-aconitate methyltransferase
MENTTKFIETYPPAVDFFGHWAEIGKDEGMEKGHAASVDFMANKIKHRIESPFSFIDCGCGNGWVVRQYSKHKNCISACGIDGADKMIEKARQTDTENNYICSDILSWTPENPMDIVHSMEVLYYLEDPFLFIKKIHDKWLSEKGCFVFGMDHYVENPSTLNWPKECGVNMNTQPIEFWLNAMKKAGFKAVQHWQTGKKENWEGTLVVLGEK